MALFLDLSMDATVCNKLFKREFIHTMFMEGRNNEDYLFMYYNVKALYNTDNRIAVTDKPHYYYRDSPQSICHQAATSANRLFFDVLYNLNEIEDDIRTWNCELIRPLYRLQDSILTLACDQILKHKIIKEMRTEDCKFVWREVSKSGYFRHGRKLSTSIKFLLMRFVPKLYLFKAKKS